MKISLSGERLHIVCFCFGQKFLKKTSHEKINYIEIGYQNENQKIKKSKHNQIKKHKVTIP